MGSAAAQGDLWGRAPDDWANLVEASHAPLWIAMMDAVGVGPGTRMLDAGCGGGGAGVLAAERGADVAGLDAAAPLIDVARRRVPAGDFRVGDLESMPYDDDTFDAVIAASSIQYAEDRVAALRELGRVASPNAEIAIGLFGGPEQVDFAVMFAAVRDTLPQAPPGDGPFGLSGPGVLEALIESAGLQITGSGEALCVFEFDDDSQFWSGNVAAGPFQAALSSVAEADLRSAVLAAVEPFRATDGSLRFENTFRYVICAPPTE